MLSTFAEQSKIYEVDLIYIPNEDVLDDGYVSVRDTLVFLELARFKTHSDAAKHLPTPSSYKLVDFIKVYIFFSPYNFLHIFDILNFWFVGENFIVDCKDISIAAIGLLRPLLSVILLTTFDLGLIEDKKKILVVTCLQESATQ